MQICPVVNIAHSQKYKWLGLYLAGIEINQYKAMRSGEVIYATTADEIALMKSSRLTSSECSAIREATFGTIGALDNARQLAVGGRRVESCEQRNAGIEPCLHSRIEGAPSGGSPSLWPARCGQAESFEIPDFALAKLLSRETLDVSTRCA